MAASVSSRNHSTRPGHRAQKKRRTRDRILANAIALFLKAGIRETRSASIAEASEVSPATLFNYFATKQDLAEAWVRGELIELLEGAADPGSNRALRSRLRLAGRSLAQTNFGERDRRLEAWRLVGRAAGAAYTETPALLRLIAREQAERRLRSDLDARRLASLLLDAFEGGIVEALIGASDVKQAESLLRARVDLILDGSRKRNERIIPAALATVDSVGR